LPSNLFFILIFIIILLIIIFCFRSFRQLIVFWFHFSMFDLLEIVLCCFSYMMLLVYFLNSSFDISFFLKKNCLCGFLQFVFCQVIIITWLISWILQVYLGFAHLLLLRLCVYCTISSWLMLIFCPF